MIAKILLRSRAFAEVLTELEFKLSHIKASESRPDGSLSGRTAIVTGASSGIGLVIGKRLAREGVNIVAAARSREPLDRAVAEFQALGVKAIAVPTDVTDNSQLQRLVESALHEFGSIDILVNNAGIETY